MLGAASFGGEDMGARVVTGDSLQYRLRSGCHLVNFEFRWV